MTDTEYPPDEIEKGGRTYLWIPENVEKPILVTESDAEKLRDGGSISFPHGDSEFVVGITDRIETGVDEDRYSLPSDENDA